MLKHSGVHSQYGGIAQLGERLNGIQEVSGSIPLISTMRGTSQKSVSARKRIFAYAAKVTMSRPPLNCSKSILKSMCSL